MKTPKGVIRFAKVDPDLPAPTPVSSYSGDAGFDLCVSRYTMIAPGAFGQIPTNVMVELPPGTWAVLLPRSSTFYKLSLIVNPGVIDGGYRGEIVGLAYNLGDKNAVIHAGDRLLQLVPVNVSGIYRWAMVKSEELTTTDRSAKGIGSTGL